jgi:ABC-type glycerol-3-phosphate transport system permease component
LIKELEKMAEKTLKSNPISDYLKKRQSEKPPKEEKRSRKEERERFKKRLASLTPAEQKYLKRKRAFDTVWPVCRALLVIGLCFVIIYPLLYMITAAFRPRSEMNDPTIIWISKSFTTSNIKDVVRVMNFWSTLGNTLFINIGCSIVQVITCAITGYGFGRFNFKGKNILFGVVIMMILVPSQIILIPQYMFFRYFNPLGIWHMIAGDYINLINSPLTMYMPAITANGLRAGLFIFLFRQSFRSLPKELEDAAYLDGCSPSGNGLYSCDNFLSIEGLNNVVIGTQLKPQYLIKGLALGGYHDYRHVGLLSDLTANLPAVQTGEHDIKKHDIGLESVEFNNSLIAVVRNHYSVAFFFQIQFKEFADVIIVINYKYLTK